MAIKRQPALVGLRILIVEDEFLVADDIAMVLEDFGCEVVGPVPTVAEAIAAITAETLDGVLLDANLDGISSAAVADVLVARGIPFVVVTGYGHLKLPSAALEAAPRVTKPWNVADLAGALADAFAPRIVARSQVAQVNR
jgi:CheY-like chemotaxis protein